MYSRCDAWLEFVLQVLVHGYCVVTLRKLQLLACFLCSVLRLRGSHLDLIEADWRRVFQDALESTP